MMRRLIQNPARSSCRRKLLMARGTSTSAHHVTSTSIRARYISSGEATRSRLDVDGNPPSAAHHAALHSRTSSRGISTRHLSTEAIRALSPSSTQDASSVMLNPLLDINMEKHGADDDTVAFFELFKAISTLNRQIIPTPTAAADVSILGVENDEHDLGGVDSNTGSACDEEGEAKLDVNVQRGERNLDVKDTDTLISDQEVSEVKSKDFNGTDTDTKTSDADHNVVPKITPEVPVNKIEREKQRIKKILDRDLEHIHNKKGHIRVMKAFREARSSPHSNEILSTSQIKDIFFQAYRYDVPASYEVLKYYSERFKAEGRIPSLDMYQRVIHRIRPVKLHGKEGTPQVRRLHADELMNLVEDLTQHIKEEYSEGKKMVYQYILLPELVVALSEHNFHGLKTMATPIMEYILDNKFPVLDPDAYQFILSKARHSETDTFPYHRVLSELIFAGHPPSPEVTLSVLQFYHPFHDIDATHDILSIIQKQVLGEIKSPSVAEDFRVDLGTLEAISKASARLSVELGLLVWDLADMFGYAPTESMFEDIIMSFAATRQDQNLFSALADMEKNGFVPNQTLLRYVAVKISYSDKRLAHTERMLTWRDNDHLRSTHGMNVLLIGHGMRRDINNSFFVFEELPKWELQPDANTFSFLMESLYIDTRERFPYEAGQASPQYNPNDIDEIIGAANIIVDSMEEAGIKKTKQFFHEHIRLLCTTGRLEDAKMVLEEAISAGTPVPMNTLFVLASRYADNEDFQNAYAVAGLGTAAGCGELPRLISTINNIKRRLEMNA